ncbi:toll/interleukin-1 receptor-like protein [Neltuma alba]|uniref:toll/interleukin-1 receptor-like protein n=1 Tax=Neltuma alba TaxID=207710 RepID=UPI0010A42000|nr:toll/interleukin-1 receptor-like protein [Prosopis alba]XP_028792025.1 toll/interleukin-1 receptor-like protein [Prosopis alba]
MGLHAKIWHNVAGPGYDVFINHRTVDTRHTVVRLLYDHLTHQGCKPFLDAETLKPGDRLLDTIDKAIRGCKVGVAVFSPRYCESYFCLHELSLLVGSKKRIVPIFYDVKPLQLRVEDSAILSCSQKDLKRFNLAIEEAKSIVGLPFDSSKEYIISTFCLF